MRTYSFTPTEELPGGQGLIHSTPNEVGIPMQHTSL